MPSSLCVSVTVTVLDGCCVPGIKCDGKCSDSGSKCHVPSVSLMLLFVGRALDGLAST